MTADAPLEPPIDRRLLWGGALLLLVVVVYLPAFGAGFVWDDDDYVIRNTPLRSLHGLLRIWTEPRASPQYYPLVFTSFWIEYHLWGLNTIGYHFTNVLLHGLGAILLWRVLDRLGVPAAWLGAALFAVHPVQVESVAWVSERKNVLSGLFYWAALLSYLRFAGIGEERPRRRGTYAACVGFFVAALLSKSVTCTLPAVLLLLVWWKQGLTRRDLLFLAPLFVLAIGMGLLTVFLEVTHVGAAGAEYELGLLQRVLLAGRAFWFYLGKLVWPVHLTFIYPRWHLDPAAAWQYLFPAAALALPGVLAWAHPRLGWGPLIACLCYAVTLFPALGFFDVYPFRYSFVADHFQYLACAAPLAVLAALATRAGEWIRPAAGRLLARLLLGLSKDDPVVEPLGVAATALLAGLLLATLGGLSFAQARAYRDPITLFQDTLAKNPGAWMAHNNLGTLFMANKQFQEAERHYRDCLDLKPDHQGARRGLAKALFSQGRADEARAELLVAEGELANQAREATQDTQKTALAQEYVEIGQLRESMGDEKEAEGLFHAALEVWPDSALAHFRLGNALAGRGRFADAIPHLRALVEAEPGNPEARFLLAQALDGAGLRTDALATAREALGLAEAEGNVRLKTALLARFPPLR